MQQSEIVVQARPPRAKRVVLLEPSRKVWRITLFVSIILLVLYVIAAAFFWTHPLYSPVWNASYIATFPIWFLPQAIVRLLLVPSRKALDERRQQAARYNLAVGTEVHKPSSDLTGLPANFVIRLRRRNFATWIAGFLYAALFAGICLLLYQAWQTTAQAILHAGISWTPALLIAGMNIIITIVLLILIVNLLIYTSRQKLIATRDGLFCRRGYRTGYIPWQKARLFAVISRHSHTRHGLTLYYELASEDTVIRWPSQPRGGPARDTPAGVAMLGWPLAGPTTSAETFQQEVQLLNIIVNARSGLPLYDLC